MNREEYRKNRDALLAEAQGFVDDWKIDEFKAKKAEIEALDARFEDEARMQASMNALTGAPVATSIENHSQQINGAAAEKVNPGFVPAEEDVYSTNAYRKAFMNYAIKGTPIPAELKNASTTTSDVGEVIPSTIMPRIIEKMEQNGQILALVTKTHFKGGLSIPTSSVKPVASWVNEGAGSEIQKKTTGSITFTYHKLRCAVSVSLEVETMAMDVFEAKLAENVSEAMVKALEAAIINGTGTGSPKGILTETAVAGQIVEIAAADGLTYADIVEAEAALPGAYEAGAKWCMSKKTFMQIVGLTDTAGQPIGRINYGIGSKPERYLLGREVVISEAVESLTSSSGAGTIPAFIFNFEDYVLNSNLDLTVKIYEDQTTDDKVTKAIMLADGKTVDLNSLVFVKVAG